jgi:hypothetical protein
MRTVSYGTPRNCKLLCTWGTLRATWPSWPSVPTKITFEQFQAASLGRSSSADDLSIETSSGLLGHSRASQAGGGQAYDGQGDLVNLDSVV